MKSLSALKEISEDPPENAQKNDKRTSVSAATSRWKVARGRGKGQEEKERKQKETKKSENRYEPLTEIEGEEETKEEKKEETRKVNNRKKSKVRFVTCRKSECKGCNRHTKDEDEDEEPPELTDSESEEEEVDSKEIDDEEEDDEERKIEQRILDMLGELEAIQKRKRREREDQRRKKTRKVKEHSQSVVCSQGREGGESANSSKDLQVGSLLEILPDGVNGIDEVESEWEEVEFAVDSGASVTVVGEEMLRSIKLEEGRPGVRYEVGDGSTIPNLG